MENNNLGNQESVLISSESENNEEEYTPKLFSEDQNYQSEDIFDTPKNDNEESDQLFDQDLSEEDDFEIPVF